MRSALPFVAATAAAHARRRRRRTTPRAALSTLTVSIAVVLTSSGAPEAQELDRIYVDQYMPLRSELMIADADGGNPRKLVPGMAIDYNAAFSHDGRWVVFTSDRSGSADIYRVRRDGRDLERLTDSPAFDDQAALSPDDLLKQQ